jgi:hypothetical protein
MMVATMPPEMGPAAVRAISRPRIGPAMKKRPIERATRPTKAMMTVFHSCLMSLSFIRVPMWTRMMGRLTAAKAMVPVVWKMVLGKPYQNPKRKTKPVTKIMEKTAFVL